MLKPHFLVSLLAGISLSSAAGPGVRNDFHGRRVLVIGIDGLRSDALRQVEVPHLRMLMKTGVTTWTGVAGGEFGGPTQQPTISGPGWATILTGRYLRDHGVGGNGKGAYDQSGGYQKTAAPHFARYLKEKFPQAEFASITSWGWIEDYLVPTAAESIAFHDKGTGGTYPERDASVRDKAVSYLSSHDPDVLFVHFDQVDGAGHATGFSPENPVYMNAIKAADGLIGDVLAAIRARHEFPKEDWLVIVTTDHGGRGTAHGGQSPEERTIPMIVSGRSVLHGRVETSAPGHHVVPATVFGFLGVPVDPAWKLEPGTFGLPPYVEPQIAGNTVRLRWTAPPKVAALTGIGIFRDGVLIRQLPASAREFIDAPPADGDEFVYQVSFTGTGDTRDTAVAIPRPADVKTGLVLDLSFEGDAADRSGRGNNGKPVNAVFAPNGRTGQALVLDATSSVDLGCPADLRFGADADFTVSFWIKAGAQWDKDPSIISNKAWANGKNPGWIIAGAAGAPSWQWNLAGVGSPRLDFDPGVSKAPLGDGAWHLVTVSHRREKNATFYQDGKIIGFLPIKNAGNTDTEFPIRIGLDGASKLPFDQPVLIDDLRIWRRALNAADVAELFQSPDKE